MAGYTGHTGRRVELNVGGKHFETTTETLLPSPLLSAAADAGGGSPLFLDRDPDLFADLLSLLRAGHLPVAAASDGLPILLDEARFYGLDSFLRRAIAPPPLAGYAASLAATLIPPCEPAPTAISAPTTADGDASPFASSLLVAHGAGLVSTFSPIHYTSTFRTHLSSITALRHLDPHLAAVGSLASPGIHFYNVSTGRHAGSVHWSDPSDPRLPKSCVTAIATTTGSKGPIFAAFEAPHHENSLLMVDPVTLKVITRFAHQNGAAAKSAAPRRLAIVPDLGLVFASGVSAGTFGYAGYIRLWDMRARDAVWEMTEPGGSVRNNRYGDPFVDADVDTELHVLCKVCSKSGDIGMADMRRLGRDDPWVYSTSMLGPKGPRGGAGSLIRCYKQQVFVSREDGLEVWSRLKDWQQSGVSDEYKLGDTDTCNGPYEGCRRSSYVDTEADSKRGFIKLVEAGGDRLFVSRRGVDGVEMWESSYLSHVESFQKCSTLQPPVPFQIGALSLGD